MKKFIAATVCCLFAFSVFVFGGCACGKNGNSANNYKAEITVENDCVTVLSRVNTESEEAKFFIPRAKEQSFCLLSLSLSGKSAEYSSDGVIFTVKSKKNEGIEIKYAFKVPDTEQISLLDVVPLLVAKSGEEYLTPVENEVGLFTAFDSSNFSVELSVPQSYVIAGGEPLNALDKGESGVTYSYSFSSARSVGFLLDKNYAVKSEKSADKSINYCFLSDTNAEETYLFIKNCFEYFAKFLGEYPYKSLTVAETKGETQSIPSTGLVTVDSAKREVSEENFRFNIALGIAEQWLKHITCANDISYSAFSPALCFYAARSFLLNEGTQKDKDFINELTADKRASVALYINAKKEQNPAYKPVIVKNASETTDKLEYVSLLINGGVNALLRLEEDYSPSKVEKALKKFVKSNKNKISSKADFSAALSSLSRIFDYYLENPL